MSAYSVCTKDRNTRTNANILITFSIQSQPNEKNHAPFRRPWYCRDSRNDSRRRVAFLAEQHGVLADLSRRSTAGPAGTWLEISTVLQQQQRRQLKCAKSKHCHAKLDESRSYHAACGCPRLRKMVTLQSSPCGAARLQGWLHCHRLSYCRDHCMLPMRH